MSIFSEQPQKQNDRTAAKAEVGIIVSTYNVPVQVIGN